MTRRWLTGVAAAALITTAAAAQDDRDGRLETTSELLVACAPAADARDRELYTAFCHGYMLGVYHFAEALARGPDAIRLVCVPDPKPDVTSATSAFVAWAQAHPEYVEEAPAETVMRWAMSTYPCP